MQSLIQQVNGKYLWYTRVVGEMLLTRLSALASQKSKSTKETMKCVKQFIDFCTSQEPAVLTYCKSNMILAGHSDTGY